MEIKNSLDSMDIYENLLGHWIIEMSEMLATLKTKDNETVKSFLSRDKDTYRTPYSRYPKDRMRQCVFGGSTNTMQFLPLDRTANRRFWPVFCRKDKAEVFILDDEQESRAYIRQMWAEAMHVYRSGKYSLKLSREMEKEAEYRRKQFMQEDVDAGSILGYMEQFLGEKVCTKQLYVEALGRELYQLKRWEVNEINEIMNQLIREGTLKGWRRFNSPRRFQKPYGRQKGWERIPPGSRDPATELTTEEDFTPVEPEDMSPF